MDDTTRHASGAHAFVDSVRHLMLPEHSGEPPSDVGTPVPPGVLDAAQRSPLRTDNAGQAARATNERQLRYATLLQRVTAAFSRALTLQAVSDVVLTEGAAAVGAALGSVNVIDPDGDTVRTVATVGWPHELLWPPFSLAGSGAPLRDAVRTQHPVYVVRAEEWPARYPEIAPLMGQVGMAGAVALPVAFEGRVQGIISFCWREPHDPAAEERALLDALAAQCGQAWERARLFAAAEEAQRRAEFLADATQTLASSLEYETTLAHLARSAVPRLADWCAVDIVEDPERDVWPPLLAPVLVMHTDPAKIAWARRMRERGPIKWEQRTGLPAALRSGATQFMPRLSEEMLLGFDLDPDDLALARELNLSAYLCVPLRSRGRTLGALTLCMAESGRHYTEADRVLAEQLAQRAATAVDNARLLRDAERARVAAEAANQAKAEFLTVMSHELRTPLNAIGGYTQLLELGIHGPITDAQRATLSRIQHSQHHLLGMINEVLNFARLEAATVEYALADVPMPALLQAVDPLLRPQADAKGLTLTFEECLADVVVRADPDKLQQVLVNLLSNAIKFTEAGGTVTISCARRAPGSDPEIAPLALVDIVVHDTGIGVAPEQVERIFEPFVQLGRSRYGPGEGTGLGLSISRDLARGMGGELVATSAVGEGSRFTLTLASVG